MARNDTEHAKREESASNRWKSGKIAPASTLPVILIRQRHRRWYCFSTTTRPLVLVCTCTFALSPHAGRTAEPEVAGMECTVGGNPTVFTPACAALSGMAGGFAGHETYTCSQTARRRWHTNAGLSIKGANKARSRKETLRDDTEYGKRKKTPQTAGKRPYSRFYLNRT